MIQRQLVVLLDLTVFDPEANDGAGGNVVLRASTAAYKHPSAPGPYRYRMTDEAALQREIFADGRSFGAGSNDHGRLRLVNADGRLDWLARCAADGRAAVLRLGYTDDLFGDFEVIFSGKCAAAYPEEDYATVVLHDDFTAVLDLPLSGDAFAGNNTSGNGVEGDTSMAGRPVEVVQGTALYVECPVVNAGKQIVAVCDRGPVVLEEVAVRGDVLTAGTQRADAAALEAAATPVSGTYDWVAGSATTRPLLRIGNNLDGVVTAIVTTGATAADRTAAQGWKAILEQRAGATVSTADVAALDALNNAECGGYWRGTEKLRQPLDAFAMTAGAGYWQDKAGTFRIARIDAPSTPLLSLVEVTPGRRRSENEIRILDLQPLYGGRDANDLPPFAIRLRCGRNYTPQSKATLAAIAMPNAERLTTEWLDGFADDAALETLHPMGAEREAETLFRTKAAADAEAARRLALFAGRRRWQARVELRPVLAAVLDLGITLRLIHSRYLLADGRDVLVTAYRINLLDQTAILTLWG